MSQEFNQASKWYCTPAVPKISVAALDLEETQKNLRRLHFVLLPPNQVFPGNIKGLGILGSRFAKHNGPWIFVCDESDKRPSSPAAHAALLIHISTAGSMELTFWRTFWPAGQLQPPAGARLAFHKSQAFCGWRAAVQMAAAGIQLEGLGKKNDAQPQRRPPSPVTSGLPHPAIWTNTPP